MNYNGGVNLRKEIKTRIEMISRGEVPEGYKRTKVGIIPEDWEVKRLGEVSNGKVKYGANAPAVEYTSHLPKYLRITDIDDSGRIIKKTQMSVNIDNYDEFLLSKDDLVFARTGNTTGKTYLYNEEDGELVYAGFLIKFSINQKLASSKFIKLYTETKNYWDWVKVMSARSGQPGINSKEYEKLRVPQPVLPEQQKIAQILSTWDEAIELKEKLIEEKKEQKKGLMQKLLTGEVRLAGFDGEWEEVRLGDIGQTFNGLTGKTSKDFGVGKPFITYKNIFANSRVDIKDVDYVKISEDENQNTTKYGDIFFTTSSETPDEVGMSSVLLDIVEELYLNSFCFGFRLNNFEILVPEYARFLFRGDVFRRKIFKLAQGSTRFNISKAEVLKLYIILPKINEQKAIAQILSTADKEIDLLNQELEQLKLQKKGLMQLLLTGIIRVKS